MLTVYLYPLQVTFTNQTILNFLNWVLNEIVYERYMLIADRVPVLMESLVGSLMYPRAAPSEYRCDYTGPIVLNRV